MFYFIKFFVNFDWVVKMEVYEQALMAIQVNLEGEMDIIFKMVIINCLFKIYLLYYYWVGFYVKSGECQLLVGLYQGILGCLYISYDKGVCGRVAWEEKM